MAGVATKHWLSGNMSPNIKTHENGWSYFSENLRVVAIKLLELTQFASPYLSNYLILYGAEVLYDKGWFPMHSLFIEKSMLWPTAHEGLLLPEVLDELPNEVHQ